MTIEQYIAQRREMFEKEFYDMTHVSCLYKSIPCRIMKDAVESFISETEQGLIQIFSEMVESNRPGTCDCVGEKYECEHWGKHELVDELLSQLPDIKK